MMKGQKILSGNEAIVQGALESGVGFASSYPGTPATEIGDAFVSVAKKSKIYFEWSSNEKTALEAAAGAAFSGVKSIVSMKHYGLNVALDSLLPLVYLECPLVVAVSDDPGCWSSIQTEQDSRQFGSIGKIPILEPSNSQECKDMTKKAFSLAWKYKTPVIIRMTPRVCYSSSPVTLGKIVKGKTKGTFEKGWYKLGSAETIGRHDLILKKKNLIQREAEKSEFNFLEAGKGKIGVITSSISYNYVKEAMNKLGLKLPLLKLGFVYPFPYARAAGFMKNLKKIIVVEELEPMIEDSVRKLEFKDKKIIDGKRIFPRTGELKPEIVILAFSKIFGKKIPSEIAENIINLENRKAPERSPLFCAGCPHRATFYALKKVLGRKKIYGGDIGCYMLSSYKPYEMLDFIVSMGASIGITHGISKTTSEKPVALIGDSTFFHAGIPALINLVYNKANALVVVLDNRVTAMCGQQPDPGTGYTALGEETKALSIEEIAKSCGADFVKTSNQFNFNQFCKDVKEAYSKKGVSVLIAKAPCRLFTVRNLARKGLNWPRFEIFRQDKKLDELSEFGCPAIMKKKGKWLIDKKLCWGCTVCQQFFPDCIRISNENRKDR